MVKVCTASGATSLASEATALESTPPDRNTPRGTSAISCILTASRNTRRRSSTVRFWPDDAGILQYCRVVWDSGAGCVVSMVRMLAGGRRWTFLRIVFGPMTKPCHR